LTMYRRGEQIKMEDKDGKWCKNAECYKLLLATNILEYEPDRRFDALVEILFPELGWSKTQDLAASSNSP